MKKKDVVVIVPIYLCALSPQEKTSLEQCVSVLSEYDIVVIKPKSLNLNHLFITYPQLKTENFPDSCFESLRAYNKLVLKENFYQRFQRYQYMLIYQLDAYVFNDELLDWATKGYDYVGAPWLPWSAKLTQGWGRFRLCVERYFLQLIKSRSLYQEKYYYYQVGNGGLSLRKITKFIDITRRYKNEINFLLDDNKPFFPEDIFLLMELSDTHYQLKKPSYKEAMRFSVEHNPQWAFICNGSRLPFGCHNWYNKDMHSFWSKFITVLN